MNLSVVKREIVLKTLTNDYKWFYFDSFFKYFNLLEKIDDTYSYEKSFSLGQKIDCENGRFADKISLVPSDMHIYKLYIKYNDEKESGIGALVVYLADKE